MKQLLTFVFLFFIGTAIGQKTTADLLKDSSLLRNFKIQSDTGYYLSLKPKSYIYTFSQDLIFVYKENKYKVEELIEMLEWFRKFKESMIQQKINPSMIQPKIKQ